MKRNRKNIVKQTCLNIFSKNCPTTDYFCLSNQFTSQNLIEESNCIEIIITQTAKQALDRHQAADWRAAMKSVCDIMVACKVWDPVDKTPILKKTIGTR